MIIIPDLNLILAWLSIGGALVAVLRVIVVKPLSALFNMFIDRIEASNKELSLTIAKLEKCIEGLKEQTHSVDLRLTAVEFSTKSLHHRVDRLEQEQMYKKD